MSFPWEKDKKEAVPISIFKMKYVCPKTEKMEEITLNFDDFCHDVYECEDCGSHGKLSIQTKCPSCKKEHEFIIRTW